MSRWKTRLKRLAVELAGRRGYLLVPEWEVGVLPLVRHLRAVFNRFGIQCVFDVGGNLGQYAKLLRQRVGYAGRIISFEPLSQYANVLKEAAKSDPAWTVVGSALGEQRGRAAINVTRSPGMNSFLSPTTQGGWHWKEDDIQRREEVEIETLDEVVARLGLDLHATPTYLKLDTQGFDLKVLDGARRSVPEVRALQTEASVRPIYAEMPTFQETLARIEKEGFALSGMFPVTVGDSLRLVEFDCVAVNERYAGDGN